MQAARVRALSPYTLEEVVARNYLVVERPDVILNIVDGTNLERNLYLTTQLKELGIPMVIAINMMDVVRKNGDKIDIEKLGKKLGIKIIEISALKSEGIYEVAEEAVKLAGSAPVASKHYFSGEVEHAIAHIEEAVLHDLPEEQQRWYAIKLFERDTKAIEQLGISEERMRHIENDIVAVERELDDDAEAIITNERYNYITDMLKDCYKKKNNGRMSVSDKIDKVVTSRIFALPIFALAMFLVYFISIGSVGDFTVTFMNDGLFGSFAEAYPDTFMANWYSVPELLDMVLLNEAGDPVIFPWLYSLIMDGIVGGVGAVLGFVPQMLVLFILLSLLEDCGYMSRVAFIMDRLFRKFGLSGKSFIPMLIGTGCSVPGIMASRTIEQDRDRKMTVMTTAFMPCSAKMPIVGLIAAAFFTDSWLGGAWVATSAYFIGVLAVILSGLMLKKTKPFSGDPAPFVMELPAYHAPVPSNVLRSMWERGWSFIKRAGTVIVAASIIIWVLNNLSFEGGFHYIGDGDSQSILNLLGNGIAWLFAPLGFGNWQAAVATVLGLVAKEEVVGVFGALGNGSAEAAIYAVFGGSALAGFSFMIFNLLCAPCFAAMGAIKREMNNWKWTAFAIAYMCVFAYAVSLIVYQVGAWFIGEGSIIGSIAAALVAALIVYLLVRKNKYDENVMSVKVK